MCRNGHNAHLPKLENEHQNLNIIHKLSNVLLISVCMLFSSPEPKAHR